MLRRLRTKFIGLNMALAALVLAASFATICYADYRSDIDDVRDQLIAATSRSLREPQLIPNAEPFHRGDGHRAEDDTVNIGEQEGAGETGDEASAAPGEEAEGEGASPNNGDTPADGADVDDAAPQGDTDESPRRTSGPAPASPASTRPASAAPAPPRKRRCPWRSTTSPTARSWPWPTAPAPRYPRRCW